MEPTLELIAALYRDKVETARRSTLEQRFLAGLNLFDLGCELMRSGIRHQHPDASEDEVNQMVRKRLRLGRQFENGSP